MGSYVRTGVPEFLGKQTSFVVIASIIPVVACTIGSYSSSTVATSQIVEDMKLDSILGFKKLVLISTVGVVLLFLRQKYI